jgi:ribosomal protein S27AE
MPPRPAFDPCDNMNHRRRDAPVSHCPECGGVVNAQIAAKGCSESKHAAARRRQSKFCVDCGTQLVAWR